MMGFYNDGEELSTVLRILNDTSYLKAVLVYFLKRAMMGSQTSVHLVDYTIQFKTVFQICMFAVHVFSLIAHRLNDFYQGRIELIEFTGLTVNSRTC